MSVSTSPAKITIDDLIQRLFDALVVSLRRSIVNDFNKMEGFLNDGVEALGKVPQTIDEIGEATQKHSGFAEQFPMVFLFI